MKIPIENLYYLLCYAWDYLNEHEANSVGTEQVDTPLNLLAHMLLNGTRKLLKKGIERNYIEVTEEVPGIKGKLLLTETFKRNSLFNQRTFCQYDEFSTDILPNRILVTTLRQLIQTQQLDKSLREKVIGVLKMLPPVTPLRIRDIHFSQLHLNRNNKLYGFVLNVCRLIYEHSIPLEEGEAYCFMDFTRDEKKMALLFEAFVRNFYKLEQTKYSVYREQLVWKFTPTQSEHERYLPKMLTDISLENDFEKIIIDTKYYTNTVSDYFDTEKIHSFNLYQLFSYLMNCHDDSEKTNKATGILLYPTVEKEYNLEYKYGEHLIRIQTLNLNTKWNYIAEQLKKIIGI